MPRFSTTRRIRHSAQNKLNLVADVASYPEYVPMSTAKHDRQTIDKGEGVTVMVAAMTVAYKLIHQTFTSRVTLNRPNLEILVEYLDGPFRHMQNRWAFQAAGDDACDVEFFIDYEFKSRTLSMLMGALFDTVFRRMVSAFEARANRIYGQKNA
jgi:coenzyme Q-binding protein COQ10